jgi:sugar lactone lactonase YvrE
VSDSEWQVVVPAGAELGERPVWDTDAGCLIWVDIASGRLHRHRPGERDDVIVTLDVTLGAAAPRRDGGYVLAASDAFRLIDRDGHPQGDPIRPPGIRPEARFNDGACDPAGRFWAGTAAQDRRPGGGVLYRLDPDGTVAVMIEGVTESNGLGWSPDGTTCYFIDSGEVPARIRAFAFDASTGTLGPSRDLVVVERDDGIPDGLVVDEAGCIWVALWGGGAVRRYAPSGELLQSLAFPVSQPSCPGFGGADLQDLYVTSAWEDMGEAARAAEPFAGHVFMLRPGVRGAPVARFAG